MENKTPERAAILQRLEALTDHKSVAPVIEHLVEALRLYDSFVTDLERPTKDGQLVVLSVQNRAKALREDVLVVLR